MRWSHAQTSDETQPLALDDLSLVLPLLVRSGAARVALVVDLGHSGSGAVKPVWAYERGLALTSPGLCAPRSFGIGAQLSIAWGGENFGSKKVVEG